MTAGIEIRESPVGGRGVFATRAFARGDVILRWNIDRRVHRDALHELSDDERHFLVPFDAEWMIVMQPPACYVNHSCDSNTEARDFCDVAVRAIAPGEEITSNYLVFGSELSFVCACGAPNCVSLKKRA